MRRFVPRALLTASLVASVAGCASGGGGAGVTLDTDTGGRYLVMIPPMEGPSGDAVANELRTLVMTMSTHVPLAHSEVRAKMAEYNVETLDLVTSQQIAQLIAVPMVGWGTVSQAGAGLQADVQFIDTRSGDQFDVQDASGATPAELAQSIFAGFQRSVEGIRQATFCNDYLSSQQYEQALQNCEAALAIVPRSVTAHYGKATALLFLERNEQALAAYDALLEVDPTHQDGLLGAGLAASRLSERQRAMSYYNRYLEVNPGNVQVRMTVAGDVVEGGDYVSAFEILEGGAAENADNQDFQRYLFQVGSAAGRQLLEEGDTAQAHEVMEQSYRAYEVGYANATDLEAPVVQRVIEVLSVMGRTDDAIRVAESASTRFPNDANILLTYSQALRQADRTEQEIEVLTRLANAQPDHETVYARRAQAYERAGRRAEAIADLNRLAARDPNLAATVMYNMGAESARAQNWAAAASVLEIAHRHAQGEVRGNVEYLWGLSILQQAAAIARANTNGNAQQFEQSLSLARRSLQLLQSSTNSAARQYIPNAEQLIANQEALLQSIRR